MFVAHFVNNKIKIEFYTNLIIVIADHFKSDLVQVGHLVEARGLSGMLSKALHHSLGRGEVR